MSWHLSRHGDRPCRSRARRGRQFLAAERWDSLRLLTPNWQSRLPGYCYDGDDPDGYMTMTEMVGYLQSYADVSGAPVLHRNQR